MAGSQGTHSEAPVPWTWVSWSPSLSPQLRIHLLTLNVLALTWRGVCLPVVTTAGVPADNHPVGAPLHLCRRSMCQQVALWTRHADPGVVLSGQELHPL